MNCKFSRTCGHEVCDIEFCPDFTEPTNSDKLEYLQAAAKGLGFCVVPLEPTKAMLRAGRQVRQAVDGQYHRSFVGTWSADCVYSAMLTAAQEDKDE